MFVYFPRTTLAFTQHSQFIFPCVLRAKYSVYIYIILFSVYLGYCECLEIHYEHFLKTYIPNHNHIMYFIRSCITRSAVNRCKINLWKETHQPRHFLTEWSNNLLLIFRIPYEAPCQPMAGIRTSQKHTHLRFCSRNSISRVIILISCCSSLARTNVRRHYLEAFNTIWSSHLPRYLLLRTRALLSADLGDETPPLLRLTLVASLVYQTAKMLAEVEDPPVDVVLLLLSVVVSQTRRNNM